MRDRVRLRDDVGVTDGVVGGGGVEGEGGDDEEVEDIRCVFAAEQILHGHALPGTIVCPL